MARITYLHWNETECAVRAAELRSAGHDVRCFSAQGYNEHLTLLEALPDAFAIDLRRLPSHGREIGAWLRQRKASRAVPLVFVDGEDAKVQRVREQLPDAFYTSWEGFGAVLKLALAASLPDAPPPVVPGGIAGHAGTPLWKKLGLAADKRLLLSGAPAGFEDTLQDAPVARIMRRAQGSFEIVLLFAPSLAQLEQRFAAALKALAPGGRLWLLWPKQSSGMRSDLNQVAVRAYGMERGLVDFKVCSIDAVWSGLCFARRG
jgi:hypothetical protein